MSSQNQPWLTDTCFVRTYCPVKKAGFVWKATKMTEQLQYLHQTSSGETEGVNWPKADVRHFIYYPFLRSLVFPWHILVELHLRSIELLYELDLKISFMCKLIQQAHATCHVLSAPFCGVAWLLVGLSVYGRSTQQLISSETEVISVREWITYLWMSSPNLEANEVSIRLELVRQAGSLWNMPHHASAVFWSTAKE